MKARIVTSICCLGFALMIIPIKAECPTIFTNYLPPSWVKLQVLSVRAMSSAELSRQPPSDVIGLDVVIRLRLSCADKSIQYYAMKYSNDLTPVGNRVNVVDDEILWYGNKGPSKESPGTSNFKGVLECQWLTLPSKGAIEWEIFDSSYGGAGECHAITVFLKHRTDTFSKEVVSPTYIVPKGNGT